MITVNYALGNIDLSDEEILTADINSDGQVDILDIIQIVNIILNM